MEMKRQEKAKNKSKFPVQTVVNGLIWEQPSLTYCMCDISGDKDVFMDFTEVSLTDPFMAMFMAA